jgi:hypothetical protein
MILLFDTNYTAETNPDIGDGSKLSLTKCQEGWFALEQHKFLVDEQGWEYEEVEEITPLIGNI